MARTRKSRRWTSVAALVAGCLIASPALAYDRDAWLADYAKLKTAMEASYANLAWFGSPRGGVDLPALDRRTIAALEAAPDDDTARQAIRAFVASLHDGHFSELTTLEPAKAGVEPEPAPADLRKADPAAGCAALGYANRSAMAFSAPFESLDGFRLEADGLTTGFRAGVISIGGRAIGVVRIRSFQLKQHPDACERAWAAHPDLDKRGDAFDTAVADAWFQALADQLARFRKEGVAIVLVDVGSNGGGNDSGDWMPRMLTAAKVSSARMMMSAAPVAQTYAQEEIDDAAKAVRMDPSPATRGLADQVTAYFKDRIAALPSRGCDMSWVWREQRPFDLTGCSRLIDMGHASGAFGYLDRAAWGERMAGAKLYWPATIEPWRGAWTGPTYALTSATSYSSAEMFAALVQDQKIAKTVGVRTGGDGCGFVEDTPPTVLPHSLLRLRMPNCVRLRADGGDEVAGVTPDIPVPNLEGESARARALKILKLIAADAPGR